MYVCMYENKHIYTIKARKHCPIAATHVRGFDIKWNAYMWKIVNYGGSSILAGVPVGAKIHIEQSSFSTAYYREIIQDTNPVWPASLPLTMRMTNKRGQQECSLVWTGDFPEPCRTHEGGVDFFVSFDPSSPGIRDFLFLPQSFWNPVFTCSLCWCVFCNASWDGHSAWNVSDTYCTQNVCLLCEFWRVAAAHHCVWNVFRRKPSCIRRVFRLYAAVRVPAAAKSFWRSFHNLLCDRCVFSCPPLLASFLHLCSLGRCRPCAVFSLLAESAVLVRVSVFAPFALFEFVSAYRPAADHHLELSALSDAADPQHWW